MRRRMVLPLTLATLITLVACSDGPAPQDTDPAVAPSPAPSGPTVSFHTQSGQVAVLGVDIADDDAERARGLMGVEELPPDEGMAFVWNEPVSTSFWMKDTLIPLSIAFWDETGRLVAVVDMQPCESDPCPTYGPGVPFVGAVEANIGWFQEHGVAVGDHAVVEERADA